MVDFRDQTRWNRLKGELAGFMAGSVLSVFVTGPQFDSVRERLNNNSYNPTPPANLGEVVLSFSPMFALPVVTATAYTLYRRRKYSRELEDRVNQRIDKLVFDFGEELDTYTSKI
jgi:hypothetical protein